MLANKTENLSERKVDSYSFKSQNDSVKIFEVSAKNNKGIENALNHGLQ